jgi:hypothetical protein
LRSNFFEQAEANMGMAMVFALSSRLKDLLDETLVERKQRIRAAEEAAFQRAVEVHPQQQCFLCHLDTCSNFLYTFFFAILGRGSKESWHSSDTREFRKVEAAV